MKTLFYKSVKLLAVLFTLIFFVSQLFGRQHWILELFTHFSFFYGVCFLLAALFLQKTWRYTYFLLGTAIVTWSLLPPKLATDNSQFVFETTTQHQAAHPDSLSIIMANVFVVNYIAKQHIQRLLKLEPDILLLPEAGGPWSKILPKVPGYPHRCGHDERSSSALQVLSKLPIKCDIGYIDDLPYARLEYEGKVIYAVHPRPPINSQLAASRKEYLKGVGKHIQNETLPTIVTGDFNLTPFSPIYRDFITQTGLTPTTQKYNPTWRPMLLPIDYTLYKNLNDNTQLTIRKLPRYGSDHNGIWIRVD